MLKGGSMFTEDCSMCRKKWKTKNDTQLTSKEKDKLYQILTLMEENISYLKQRQWPTIGEIKESVQAYTLLVKELKLENNP